MSGGGEEETTLKFTPTWVVAALCTVIVSVSLAVERLIHYAGKYLKKNKHKPLYEALLKIKEELMMMGFMSLLLAVPQPHILQICVPANAMRHLLPYSLSSETNIASTNSRRLFGVEGFGAGYCAAENNVPMLSLEALNHLDNFIFVLAIVHVTLSVLTVILGGVKMRQWKHWEESFAQDYYTEMVLKPRFTLVHQHHFIRNRFRGSDMYSVLLSWLHSFGNQIYGSVTKSDYKAMRLGFYMSHCSSNPKFNFYKYMTRVLENDFKKVVGISWYLWIFVVIFLLLNINGWHTYFWIAFIPFILLLAVGTKLEHVISQLAREVAEKHNVVVGELIVQPSDEHFWFNRPHIILYLIHFILFQNAFEMAFFFWIWVQYGFNSCIMGQVRYIVPRLIIGYSTLPLYALVTQLYPRK